MSALPQFHFISEAEYLEREEAASEKHEYFRGEVFLMAGAKPRHNDISSNINASLKNQLRGRPCKPRASDQRVRTPRTGLYTYPDIVVACPPFSFVPPGEVTLADATVIFEILSPSTANYDRNQKFDFYRELPSLRHYVVIEQAKIEVVHHFSSDGQNWQTQTLANLFDVIELGAFACRVSLEEIYEDIVLD